MLGAELGQAEQAGIADLQGFTPRDADGMPMSEAGRCHYLLLAEKDRGRGG